VFGPCSPLVAAIASECFRTAVERQQRCVWVLKLC
jgi:hypothetical protein